MSELEILINNIDKNTNIYSEENLLKADYLEKKKSSTKTSILYFLEKQLINIKSGFNKGDLSDIKATPLFGRRSLLEYLPSQRHPIPYCVVRNKDKYFLIFREGGSGESRLVGKKGLLGGHIDEVDMVINNNKLDLIKTIENGMYRELQEEANLTKDRIENISFLGFIKIEELNCVENDHLAIVYIIDINNDKLQTTEEGILSGGWFSKEEIINNKEQLESWSELIFNEIL